MVVVRTTEPPGRDREKDASRLSTLSSLILSGALALYFLSHPKLPATAVAAEEPQPLAIELVEIPEAAPVPEIVPEPQVEPRPEPEPEIQPEPEAQPEPEPEPVPQPRPQPRPKPKEKPRVDKPKEPRPTPPAAAQAAAQRSQPNFVGSFLREVERCKYYPKPARQAGIIGTVKVRVSFDGRGYVTGASLVPGDYHPALGEAALRTINKVQNRWAPSGPGPSSLVVPIQYLIR